MSEVDDAVFKKQVEGKIAEAKVLQEEHRWTNDEYLIYVSTGRTPAEEVIFQRDMKVKDSLFVTLCENFFANKISIDDFVAALPATSYERIDREYLFGSLFEDMGDAYSRLDDKKNALRCYNVAGVNGYNTYLDANRGSRAVAYTSGDSIDGVDGSKDT